MDHHQKIRAAFPALRSDLVFLENAGGSQVPAVVADRIRDYILNTYVQLGAGYALSLESTKTVQAAHGFVERLMNAVRGHVILGASSTSLMHILAHCYAEVLPPGSEIILAESGHEASLGPWVNLANRGMVVKWWRVDPRTGLSDPSDLAALLTKNTALVAFPHVSNLLGAVADIAAITSLVHNAGARVVVDGVAYAPHRVIDVDAWDVDWYVYSTYKVYGPHMAALYGREDALGGLTGPNHFFIPREEVPYKFEPGGVSHEGCAGLLGLGDYLAMFVGRADSEESDRAMIVEAFERMSTYEIPLQQHFLKWLSSRTDLRVVGPPEADHRRVPTISFVHDTLRSSDITAAVDRRGVAIRHGHMYAYRLCQAMGIDPDDGVVRVSAVHYNTIDEIQRLIDVLEDVLRPPFS